MDKILEQYGLSYEDLNSVEKAHLDTMMTAVQQSQMTLDKVRDFIHASKESVEQELTKTGTDTKQDIFLKARLRNYMLLEAFISTPEKAKKALENALSGFIKK